jgi:hypothetical protein
MSIGFGTMVSGGLESGVLFSRDEVGRPGDLTNKA